GVTPGSTTASPWWISYPATSTASTWWIPAPAPPAVPYRPVWRPRVFSGRNVTSTGSSPRPSTVPRPLSTGSWIRRPIIWYPPQMPTSGRPARACATTASASPVARSQSRSATVDLLPGRTTRSAAATSAGFAVRRTATPGSAARASTSVPLEIRGRRTTATVSHSVPRGGAGRPTSRPSSYDSESSVSTPRSPRQGSTPYTGRPVSSVSMSRPGLSSSADPRNLLITYPATSR